MEEPAVELPLRPGRASEASEKKKASSRKQQA